MKFGQPVFLLLLPLLIVGLGLTFRWGARRRANLLVQFTGDPARRWSGSRGLPGRSRWDEGLALLAVGAVVLALARPLLFIDRGQPELRGVSYLVALDASRSMLANDVRPSRYAAATNALDGWLARAANNRIGLVTFAGAAYLNAPLTFDTSALRLVLRYVEPEDLLEGGSSLSAALERAAAYFVTNGLPQRLVVVISDGEELEGDAVATAQRLHAEAGLTVCTIGVGTPAGARIPATRRERTVVAQAPATGSEVATRLDEARLRRIAQAGGGQYYPLGAKGEGLDRLRREVIDRIEETAARSNLQNYRELGQIPLALAALCLLVRLGLRADGAVARGEQTPQPILSNTP
jgi:Ca-activated chloride channel family protein